MIKLLPPRKFLARSDHYAPEAQFVPPEAAIFERGAAAIEAIEADWDSVAESIISPIETRGGARLQEEESEE